MIFIPFCRICSSVRDAPPPAIAVSTAAAKSNLDFIKIPPLLLSAYHGL